MCKIDNLSDADFEKVGKKVSIRYGNGSGCKEWPMYRMKGGYGVVSIGTVSAGTHLTMLAHRVLWSYYNNEFLAGRLILHKCDNPSCGNPTHLYAGTYQNNSDDKWSRGRGRLASQVGVNNGNTTLTENDVNKIRYLHKYKGATQKELGAQFGLTQSNIGQIVRENTWRHLL